MWSPRLMFWSNVMSCELLWKIGDHLLIRSLNNVYVHNFMKNRKTKQVKRVSSAKFRSFGSRRMYSFIFGCEELLYVVVMSYHLHCVPKENYNVLFYGCWLLFLFAHYPLPPLKSVCTNYMFSNWFYVLIILFVPIWLWAYFSNFERSDPHTVRIKISSHRPIYMTVIEDLYYTQKGYCS